MNTPRTASLWADRGCPFAHRVRALSAHLGWELELHECEVGERPEGISRYSPSGRIPLLVHGAIVLGESRVMLEHLADHAGFAGAFPGDLEARALHREAMALVDAFIVPRLGRTTPEHEAARRDEILDVLERATATAGAMPCLLAFHAAPIWLRLSWWTPEGPTTRAVEARPRLRAWLDAATELESVRATSPDRAAHVADFARSQFLFRSAGEGAERALHPASVCINQPEYRRDARAENESPRNQP